MKKLVFFLTLLVSTLARAAPAPAASGGSKSGSRDWVVDGKVFVELLLTNNVKADDAPAADESGQSFDVEFGRNLEKMEFGPRLGYYNASKTSASSRGTILGAYFRWNFIPNRSGVSLVPYARFDVLSSNEDLNGKDDNKTILALSGGATWFPINDVIGLSAYLAYTDSKVTGAKIEGFSISTKLGIYF